MQGALTFDNGSLVHLGAADLALYGWLAEGRRIGKPPARIPGRIGTFGKGCCEEFL